MIKYSILSREEIGDIKGFLDPEIYESFFMSSCRYALCAIDNNKLCGVLVFDGKKIIEVVDISVLEPYKGTLEYQLMEKMIYISDDINAEDIVIDVYDSAYPISFRENILNEGFKEVSKNILYRFSLEDIIDNAMIKRAKGRDGIVPLNEADDVQKRAFSNFLIQNKLFDRFLSDDIADELSVVYIDENRIMGCVLVSVLTDQTFNIEYVYIDKEVSVKLPSMLSSVADRLAWHFGEMGADGYVLSTNEKTDDLIHKVALDAVMMDCVRTYAFGT